MLPTHSARRDIAGYLGLVGTVPPTISALTALTRLCVPMRGRAPAYAAQLPRCTSVWLRAIGPVRDQAHGR